jgi:tetratricopeptide (TPR) repeat protein
MKAIARGPALVAVWLCLALSDAVAHEKFDEAMKGAREKLQKKDFAGAREDADAAMALAKTPAETISAAVFMAQVSEASGDLDKARADYEKAIALPALPPKDRLNALFSIARSYERQKKPAEARAGYERIAADADASPSAKASAISSIANSWLNEKGGQATALAEYERALAVPDLPAKDRLNILTSIARAHERTNAWDAAINTCERIVADKDADNRAKIAAIDGAAGNYLQKWDMETANATQRRALALPGLRPAEQVTALTNMAKTLERQLDYPAARDTYAKILEIDPSDASRAKVDALVAATWRAVGDYDRAIEIYRRSGSSLELADTWHQQGKTDEARAEYRKVFADPKANDGTRSSAFAKLLILPETAQQDAEEFLPGLTEKDPNRVSLVMPLLRQAMEGGDYPKAAWAASIVIKAPSLPAKDYALVRFYLINSQGAMGKAAEARQVAETAAADEKLSPADRFRARLSAAALAPDPKPGDMKKAYDQAVAAVEKDVLPPQARAEAVLKAARTAMMAGRDSAVRELYALHQSLFAREDARYYVCEFMPNAPSDVGSWLASPMLKDPKKQAKLDRRYGENLRFLLETDAATTGRGVSADSKESGDNETGLYMACDAKGLHICLLAADSRAEEVRNGLLGGGSYEGYLAPGDHQAYYCFLIDLPSGGLSESFQTMYPNRQFRQARTKDGTVRSGTMPTDKGFATYLFYAWELFHDKLPKSGDKWQFEVIRWARSGGFSWAGSQSVHNRSSWGDIVFSLTPESLVAIKRNLVFSAWARYKQEKNPSLNGVIDFWQDAELGDPQFYRERLAPVVERLDDLGKKVSVKMTPEDVELLFAEAVPDWMEFRYKAAELRRIYLEEKLCAAEKP